MTRLRLAVSIATLVLAAPLAAASPISGSDIEAMNRLPARMLDHPTPAEERQFVTLLARYGVDQPELYRPETRELFVEKYKALKPYLVASQRNGGEPEESIQSLVRSLGGREDRDRMCTALREWLSLPDDSLRPAKVFYLLTSGANGKNVAKRELWGARCRAAEMLSDWGDTTALPLMRALLAGSIEPERARFSMIESVRRIESPDSAVFLTADASGRIVNHRSLAEVASASAGAEDALERGRGPRLDFVQIQRLWTALSGAMFGRRSPWTPGNSGVRLEFKNGLRALLVVTGAGSVEYTDNSRIDRWALTLDSAALNQVVSDLSGAASP
jgi:hypothetical protein